MNADNVARRGETSFIRSFDFRQRICWVGCRDKVVVAGEIYWSHPRSWDAWLFARGGEFVGLFVTWRENINRPEEFTAPSVKTYSNPLPRHHITSLRQRDIIVSRNRPFSSPDISRRFSNCRLLSIKLKRVARSRIIRTATVQSSDD